MSDEELLRTALEAWCRRHLMTTCRDCRIAPAEFILWGKLLPAEALGPKCYDCAAEVMGHSPLGDPQYAILDLRGALSMLHDLEVMSAADDRTEAA